MFTRTVPARMPENGVLTQTKIDTRRNRELFYVNSGHMKGMPLIETLWRNESQPGNTLDERDEQCTAQSRPGMQPEYLGIDDYECDGKVLHYVVCEVPFMAASN